VSVIAAETTTCRHHGAATYDLARSRGHGCQHAVLGGAQAGLARGRPHGVRGRVQLQAAGRVRRTARPARGEHLQPGRHLAQLERLDDVVVGAGCEAVQLVLQCVHRGEEQHGCRLTRRLERLHDVTSVGVGQPDVHDDDVDGPVRHEKDECFACVVGEHHVVPHLP
jgi:hypothetical protein